MAKEKLSLAQFAALSAEKKSQIKVRDIVLPTLAEYARMDADQQALAQSVEVLAAAEKRAALQRAAAAKAQNEFFDQSGITRLVLALAGKIVASGAPTRPSRTGVPGYHVWRKTGGYIVSLKVFPEPSDGSLVEEDED